jgi:chemotaxis protein CheC
LNSQIEDFNAMQQDIFREIANIGAGHASSALSMLLECAVEQDVPEVKLVPLGDMIDILGGAEREVVSVAMEVSGSISGYLLAILDFEQAKHIIETIRNQPLEKPTAGFPFSPIDESALKEAVNITGGSYLTAISQMTGLNLYPTSPTATLDMLGAVLSVALVQAGLDGDYVLYFKSGLFSSEQSFTGDLLLIPDQESYGTLLRSLGCL